MGDTSWYVSIIRGTTLLSDWSFETPRPVGQNRPSICNKLSESRLGSSNPSLRGKEFSFGLDEISRYAKEIWKRIEEGSEPTSVLWSELELKFPNYSYFLVSLFDRKFSKWEKIELLLGITIENWKRVAIRNRGLKISEGQLNSDKFRKMASSTASNLLSKWRLTLPQLVLHQMIKSVDEAATLEKKIKMGDSFKSYDIFSPKVNALIEMHGRIWHESSDKSRHSTKLDAIVTHNTKNDLKKKQNALELGYRYEVFWDDHPHLWSTKIKEIYGNTPISLEEAANKVGEELGRETRVRYIDADHSKLCFGKRSCCP